MARDLSEPIKKLEFVIQKDDAGSRLDHFLSDRVSWRSRSDLQDRIRTGTVRLNDRPAKAAQKLRAGDVVTIHVRPDDIPDQDPAAIPVDIVFEDDTMIVVNKQAGLVVHPTGAHVYDTLMNALWLRDKRAGRVPDLHVVHRLDQDTSGILAVARTLESKALLQEQFESREPRKSYLALCEGVVARDSDDIDLPIGRDEVAEIRIKMRTGPGLQPSLTSFEVVERFAAHTLVRAFPHTGRQHQIRVHLAAIGHPIVCDPLYGDPRALAVLQDGAPIDILARHGLHASTLDIRHPTTHAEQRFEAPLAADIRAVLIALRSAARLLKTVDRHAGRWG